VNDEEREGLFQFWDDTGKKRDGSRSATSSRSPTGEWTKPTRSLSPCAVATTMRSCLWYSMQATKLTAISSWPRPTRGAKANRRDEDLIHLSFDLERQPDGTILGYPKTRIEIR